MQSMTIGIVDFATHGVWPQIRFRRPYFVLSFMAFLLFSIILLQSVVIWKFGGRGLAVVLLLVLLFSFVAVQMYKTYMYNCVIELQKGKIVCRINGLTTKTIAVESIHGITASIAAEAFFHLQSVPNRPAVLIVAEPENATIVGPRKFTEAEADFMLTILNKHRHNILSEPVSS